MQAEKTLDIFADLKSFQNYWLLLHGGFGVSVHGANFNINVFLLVDLKSIVIFLRYDFWQFALQISLIRLPHSENINFNKAVNLYYSKFNLTVVHWHTVLCGCNICFQFQLLRRLSSFIYGRLTVWKHEIFCEYAIKWGAQIYPCSLSCRLGYSYNGWDLNVTFS